MDKYKSNSLYDDVRLLALHVIETRKDILPTAFSPVSGLAFSIDTKTYAKRFVVKVEGVPEGVCKKIISVQDTLIDDVYVGKEGIKTCSGSQTMGFIVFYNGKYALGGGTSGDTGNTGDTGDTGEVDPCKGIVVETNCGISEDIKDGNGCVLVEKISCSPGRYCLGRKCELCPEPDTCSGEVCCSLTGRNDVCGNPTKEFGTISIVTHSDLNSNGCCVTSTEESCSLNPITPRTCTPTCEGTCQGDGTCRLNCNEGESYNERAEKCCPDLTVPVCHELTPGSLDVCPTLTYLSMDASPCTTEDGQEGKCREGVCEKIVTCPGELSDDGRFCISSDSYSWAEASLACTENGMHLSSIYEVCPDWDGTLDYEGYLGDGICPVIWSSSFNNAVWTSTTGDADTVIMFYPTGGNVYYTHSSSGVRYRVLCVYK